MSSRKSDVSDAAPATPLRLWPGVVAVMFQWLGMFAMPVVVPEATAIGGDRRTPRRGGRLAVRCSARQCFLDSCRANMR